MTYRKIFFLLLAPALFFFFSRCANPISPEGGAKDILPPRLVQAEPPVGTTHFSSSSVRLTFDEFINLKEQTKNVIIAPPDLPGSDFKVRGKTLVIDLKDKLRENTTYTINFGNSIQDITENNILKDFVYYFSTGAFIDSLSMHGKVISAFDLTPQKNVLVMMYLNNNDTIPFDSLPYRVKPYYLTRTNDEGTFYFTHIIDKPLLIFALDDQNGNFMYDMPTEKIAFLDTLVHGYYIPPEDTAKVDSIARTDSTEKSDSLLQKAKMKSDTVNSLGKLFPSYTLHLFAEKDTTQKLLKSETVKEGQLALYFRNPLTDAQFRSLQESDTGFAIAEYSPERDTVYLWLNRHQQDTLKLSVTEKGLVIDTVVFPVGKQKKQKNAPKLSLISNLRDNYLNQFRSNPVLTVSYPLARADFSKIMIGEKDTVPANVSFYDSTHRSFVVKHQWKEGVKYHLIIPDSILFSSSGITNDSTIITFTTRETRDLGSLAVDLTSAIDSPGYILQLLNEKEALIEQRLIKIPGKSTFSYLSPGKYKVKIIADRNNNGKWDAGRYIRKIQPESVYYFPGIIEVRANWDVEEKWEIR